MDTRALGKAPTAAVVVGMLAAVFGAGIRADGGSLPPFHEMQHVAVKKQRFFDYLEPVVRTENDLIRRQRGRLLEIARAREAGEPMSWMQLRYLHALAREYRVHSRNLPGAALIDELRERVDVIPTSLVLVQAAKESGWGSSRFARRANNLFGQWCFETGCGLVPRERPAGMTHEVRSFDSVRDSVASYMLNLNTHPSYRGMRLLRSKLREQARPLSGVRLAEGLTRYSAHGAHYVREVQGMIRQNGLEHGEVSVVVAGS